jgi:hypothetical protein
MAGQLSTEIANRSMISSEAVKYLEKITRMGTSFSKKQVQRYFRFDSLLLCGKLLIFLGRVKIL